MMRVDLRNQLAGLNVFGQPKTLERPRRTAVFFFLAAIAAIASLSACYLWFSDGRPIGKFAEQSIKDLLSDWQKHGPETIERVRVECPDVYFRVAFSTLPKDVSIAIEQRSGAPFDGFERAKVRRLLDMVDTVAAATANDIDTVFEWLEEDLRARMARKVVTVEQGTEIDG
jgi:hypothetical protein